MEKSADTIPSTLDSKSGDSEQIWLESKDNPLNWSQSKKYQTIGLISFQAFIS